MGLVWLARPVLWHSNRDSHGHSSATPLTEYQTWLKGTRFRNWYTADWDYGLTSVYFMCAAIGIFTIANIWSYLAKPKSSAGRADLVDSKSLYSRFLGLMRYFSSKQYHLAVFGWYSPPLGPILMIVAMMVFFMTLTFAVRPYYWPVLAMGNSPPLGTRAGWISMGILPFMMVFATKFNLIGMLTGVPHEKLQVYHRWTAWIMYITSLVHTFPFIVTNVRYGTMELNYRTKSYYWTGVAALIPQTWLILMSWGPIRSRYYETFKKLHFIASGIFMSFLFIHCNFRLTSWDYIWATAGLYFFSWFARIGLIVFRNGTHQASFETLPDRLVKVKIPTTLNWAPGQHYFVRFLDLGIHALTSHPFTVTTLPSSASIEFYIRVHDGMTARLSAFAGQNRTSTVSLDGPYGGVHGSLGVYDKVLLLAGGSGASFTVPLFLDLVRSLKEKSRCKQVHFVWAVRSDESLQWYESVFKNALKSVQEGTVTLSIFVTDSSRPSSPSSGTDSKEGEKSGIEIMTGRPNLPQIVKDTCTAVGTVGIATCGPDAFSLDVRNAVAECELAIAKGVATCTEIYLHTEAYSW